MKATSPLRGFLAVTSIFRNRNIAEVSFALWLCSIFMLAPCWMLSMVVCEWIDSPRQTEGMLVLWLAFIAAAIWWLGKRYGRDEWDISLSCLKVMQIAVMIAFVPMLLTEKEGAWGYHYVSLLTEGLQLGSLVIYAFFCFRVGRRPGLLYCGQLILTAFLMQWSYRSMEKALGGT